MALTATAQIVSVGAVPIDGQPDHDSARVAAALSEAGVPVASRIFIDDDEAALERTLRLDDGGPGLTVLLAGGGGSAGDIVRRALARITGARLALNDRMLAALEEWHRRLDRPLPRRAERLALLPQAATVWVAADGEPAWALATERGAWAVVQRGHATDEILDGYLVPFATAHLGGVSVVLVRTLKTAGVAAGDVEERLVEWLGRDGDVSVSTLPADGEVWVRLRARAATVAEATAALAETQKAVTMALGTDCYGTDAETLEEVVGRALLERGLTVSVAESCTGGLLGHRLTSIAGSSRYFERGVIVYSNEAKQALLGVPEAVLRAHGAVSGPCAEAMARGICEASGSPCGLSVTGIAGPGGGTPTKPVGTVFIGLAVVGAVTSRRFRFTGDRASVKWQSSQMALDMLRRRLREATR
jgi:nicotinamide-nucleotide amidase